MKTLRSWLLSVFLLIGLAAGTIFLSAAVNAEEQPQQIYTCSMHPQVRLPNPGKCPICSMDLVPIDRAEDAAGDSAMLRLSDHARAMASVETAPVVRRELAHQVQAVGKVAYNETALATITTRVDGYAEHLFVNFTGIDVNKGDHLAEIYSPDLVVAQQELLLALRSGDGGPSYDSAVLKLRRWGLSAAQIKELTDKRKVTERITLFSPISGTVISRNVTQNAAFKAGDALYQIANLDTVWVYLDIYESQLPWLRYGQRVTLATESFPGQTFEGVVTFVSPLVDEEARTIKVPVHIENGDHLLKPGMFVSARIHAVLADGGHPSSTGVEGKYTCPMHPQIIRDKKGVCPHCGMDLALIPGAHEAAQAHPLVIPVSAVLDSGTRKIVYVEKAKGQYQGREVTLGPKAGDFYPVLSGLQEGEQVAVRGNFLLDSQAQISGKPSLFYPHGAGSDDGGSQGTAPSATHKH